MKDAFVFEDYSNEDLLKALEWKLKEADLTATDTAKKVAIDVLEKARNRPNFGNIGEVENLLSEAKIRYQTRQNLLPPDRRSSVAPFEPKDFDPGYDRGERASENLAKLFKDVSGFEGIVEKLSRWQTVAKNSKARGKDPRDFIPTSFVFKGPPGKFPYEMSLLSLTRY
jgi:AAA lid domain